MRLIFCAVIALLVFVQPCFAKSNFQEEALVLDVNMQAIHLRPTGKKVSAAVLLIHGWSGQMNEVGDMFKRYAEQLADNGIASIRVNIRGESERERTEFTLDSTFASRVHDAEVGLKYLLSTYPKARIGITGFSLGGSTAMALTGRYPSEVSSLILWSTAGNPAEMLTRGLSAAEVKTVLEEGEVILPRWETLRATQKHILGMLGHDVFSGLSAFEGALLSIRGSEDYVPAQEQKIIEHASAKREEYRIFVGADHIFQSFDPESQFDERLIKQSLEWMLETLL